MFLQVSNQLSCIVIKANISRRSTDKLSNTVLLLIFTHIKTHQFNTHTAGKLFSNFSFTYASWSHKQETTNGFIMCFQSCLCNKDLVQHCFNGNILSKHFTTQSFFKSCKICTFFCIDLFKRQVCNL